MLATVRIAAPPPPQARRSHPRRLPCPVVPACTLRHPVPHNLTRTPGSIPGGGFIMAIVVQDLEVIRPDGAMLFSGVSFHVGEKEHAALIGVNGVGKSTLLRVLARELRPSQGSVQIDGGLQFMPQQIGRMFGKTTVRELLAISLAPAVPPARPGADRRRARPGREPLRRGRRPPWRCHRPLGRERRLSAGSRLGPLHHTRPAPIIGSGRRSPRRRALRRRAEAPGAGDAADLRQRQPPPGRARQLPRHRRQALARADAERVAQDDPAGQPRPRAVGQIDPQDRHPRRVRRLGPRQLVRHLLRGPRGSPGPPRRCPPALERGGAPPLPPHADDEAARRHQRWQRQPGQRCRDPLEEIRRRRAAPGARPAISGSGCACEARSPVGRSSPAPAST